MHEAQQKEGPHDHDKTDLPRSEQDTALRYPNTMPSNTAEIAKGAKANHTLANHRPRIEGGLREQHQLN